MAEPLRYVHTHAVGAGATDDTAWFKVGGNTLLDLSYYWTGTIIAPITAFGYNGGPSPTSQDYQPRTDATDVEIFPVDNFVIATSPNGTASTSGTNETFSSVGIEWLRFRTIESNTQAGVIYFTLIFKTPSA